MFEGQNYLILFSTVYSIVGETPLFENSLLRDIAPDFSRIINKKLEKFNKIF